ncbi:pentatricopeptide repeat (PPR) superfamily protein [Artemisia annua]|uniref:Pentatricopeptide repeat (PPR) superfamily protein n=1 Tax=Artemisia annua TaxID=35608 RepID=A0A2U1KI21_ARTAN|nr:pentatricopeptide repeat (PPR) superfamily protein [Artemisia annua]
MALMASDFLGKRLQDDMKLQAEMESVAVISKNNYFDSMEKAYKITPRSEHYACVVDLLACRKYRLYSDRKRGELAAESLKKLDPENSGARVLILSNIYAKEQQWEDVRSVRKTMKEENVKKLLLEAVRLRVVMRGPRWCLFGQYWIVFGLPCFGLWIGLWYWAEEVVVLVGWIMDVDNKVHVFGVEDWCHPHKKGIDLKLDSLLGKIVEVGYVPDTE